MDLRSMLNPQVANVPPSGIRRFFDIAAEMKDCISLGVGEPDFVTPHAYREAAIRSINRGETQYTGNRGTPELRKEIVKYLEHRFNMSYHPDTQTLVTVGGSEGIDLVLRAIITPGDEVLLPEPCFVAYAACVTFAGGVPVPVVTTADHEFRVQPQQLQAAITPRTKAVILSYPTNPTGGVMERADMEAVAAVLRQHDILVISDEIYAELSYDTEFVSVATLPGMKERTVMLSGFSKAFAMTGWRLGYACGPQEIIDVMLKIHQYSLMCASTMSQAAALQALRKGYADHYADVRKMVEQYDRRRRVMLHGFRSMGLDCFEPKGAFYTFPSIRCTGQTSEAFSQGLLQERVAVVPGSAFGASGEGHVRCCYAVSMDNINEALQRMERYVAAHRVPDVIAERMAAGR